MCAYNLECVPHVYRRVGREHLVLQGDKSHPLLGFPDDLGYIVIVIAAGPVWVASSEHNTFIAVRTNLPSTSGIFRGLNSSLWLVFGSSHFSYSEGQKGLWIVQLDPVTGTMYGHANKTHSHAQHSITQKCVT